MRHPSTSAAATLPADRLAPPAVPDETLRVVLADPDPDVREQLRALLDAQPAVAVAGACASGADAADQVHAHAPEVLVVDATVADPALTAAAQTWPLGTRPAVVLLGDRRAHATRGYELEAIDFLLKPITAARLATALRRVREHRQLVDAAGRAPTLAHDVEVPIDGTARLQHLLIKHPRRMYLVPVHEVTRFEAYGNYVRCFAHGRPHLIRETMDRLESRLDPNAFVRVHRTCIVRIACIREMRAATPGSYGVVLADGTRVRMSRSYRARFQERFAAR